jgi:hypothetical protein
LREKLFEFILAVTEETFHYLDGKDFTLAVWNLRVQLVS